MDSSIISAAVSATTIYLILMVLTNAFSIPSKYFQLISLVIGMIWIPLVNLAAGNTFSLSYIVLGIMTGLSAPGLNEVTSTISNVVTGKARLVKSTSYRDPKTNKFVKG